MSQPHVCPVCKGLGRHRLDDIGLVPLETCQACKGACVLWEPDDPELRAAKRNLSEYRAFLERLMLDYAGLMETMPRQDRA